jgi:hypothetical protein
VKKIEELPGAPGQDRNKSVSEGESSRGMNEGAEIA